MVIEDASARQASRSRAALLALLLVTACGPTRTPQPAEVSLEVPAWAADAIWYQIFVERFRNGDPSNDPTAHDIIGVTDEHPPKGWRPTPWTWDWYRQEPWAAATGKDFYGTGYSRDRSTVQSTARRKTAAPK